MALHVLTHFLKRALDADNQVGEINEEISLVIYRNACQYVEFLEGQKVNHGIGDG